MKNMNKGKPVSNDLNEPIVEQAVMLEPGVDDSDQNQISRRNVLKKWAKAGAIASIAAAGYTASLGCFNQNTCKCKCPSHNRTCISHIAVNNCTCNEVCTCNKVCTSNPC